MMGEDKLLDWTVSNAPWPEEAPAAPLPPVQPASRPSGARRAVSRWTWMLLGALPVLALLFTKIFSRLENQRIRREVEAVIAQQEQARLDGDWTKLRSSYGDDNMGWPNAQILRMRNGGFATPIELPGLGLARQAGRVGQFQILGPQSVRADVIRTFTFLDGAQVNLALPQFYQFADGAWRQVAPPEIAADQTLQLHGARVDITYYPGDAALATRLVHDLDALLAKACADWDCPPDARVPVRFDAHSSNLAPSSSPFSQLLLPSWTFQLIFARQDAANWREISLPTSLQGGYPADASATETVLRAASLEALLGVAQRLAPETSKRGDNPYLDALVVREAVRLGLETQQLAERQIANPLDGPDELWYVPRMDYFSDSKWPEALVILNQLLKDRNILDERRLLKAFDTATEPRSWLAAGLGLSLELASAQLDAAAAFPAPVPAVQSPGFVPEMVLNCSTGPMLATLAGQMAPLFKNNAPDTYASAWSPDGRRVAVSVSDRVGMIDLSTTTGFWLPRPMFPHGSPLSWASATVVEYPSAAQIPTNVLNPYQNNDLAILDTQSRRYLAPIKNTYSYKLSPNGDWAATVGNPFGTDSSLMVIPALGGNAVLSATNGYNAAWSPDNRRLVYAVRDTTGFGLMVYNMVGGSTATVLSSDDPGIPAIPHGASFSLAANWSPAGDQLAVTGSAFGNDGSSGWVGLVAPDGRGLHFLQLASTISTPYGASFSADGQFLAVGEDSYPQVGVAIYSASDGRLLRSIPNIWSTTWSPNGHILVVSADDGISLLPEPGDLSAKLQPFGPPGCRAAIWGLLWRPS